jgi:hypothetical protein
MSMAHFQDYSFKVLTVVQHNGYPGSYQYSTVCDTLYVPGIPFIVSNPNVYDIKRLLLKRTQKARIVDPEISISDPTSEKFRVQIRIIFSIVVKETNFLVRLGKNS